MRPPPSVSASARKNAPVTPERNTSGRNTTITVPVDAISGRVSSALALRIATSALVPAAWARWIASIITIASSMKSPIPAASPPSVIMLKVMPNAAIAAKVIAMVHGTTIAATNRAHRGSA